MRTRDKQLIFKRFMAGLSVHQLANMYRTKGKMNCEIESEVEQAIRDCTKAGRNEKTIQANRFKIR